MMRRYVRLALCSIILLALTASACKKDEKPTEEPTAEEPDTGPAQQKQEEKPAAADTMPSHTSATPPTESQAMYDGNLPGVTLKIVEPKEGQTLPSGDKVNVKISLEGYRIGKDLGQHVHLILDNNPYSAHYDVSEPIVLENLKPGTHTLRAFPARHYHMSLKKGDVFSEVTFSVEKKSDKFAFDASKPYLTYSRPKGTYSAAAAKAGILLDYWVKNAQIGKDAKVVYSVDGKTTEMTEWKPVMLPALQPGEHEINLKLVDMKGKLIDNGGYNDTTRKITVK